MQQATQLYCCAPSSARQPAHSPLPVPKQPEKPKRIWMECLCNGTAKTWQYQVAYVQNRLVTQHGTARHDMAIAQQERRIVVKTDCIPFLMRRTHWHNTTSARTISMESFTSAQQQNFGSSMRAKFQFPNSILSRNCIISEFSCRIDSRTDKWSRIIHSFSRRRMQQLVRPPVAGTHTHIRAIVNCDAAEHGLLYQQKRFCIRFFLSPSLVLPAQLFASAAAQEILISN